MNEPLNKPIDMQLALQDPQQIFSSPEEVRDHAALGDADKIQILQHWAYDVRDVEVAEEEGMPAFDQEGLLKRIMNALSELGAEPGSGATRSPTKQGND